MSSLVRTTGVCKADFQGKSIKTTLIIGISQHEDTLNVMEISQITLTAKDASNTDPWQSLAYGTQTTHQNSHVATKQRAHDKLRVELTLDGSICKG